MIGKEDRLCDIRGLAGMDGGRPGVERDGDDVDDVLLQVGQGDAFKTEIVDQAAGERPEGQTKIVVLVTEAICLLFVIAFELLIGTSAWRFFPDVDSPSCI